MSTIRLFTPAALRCAVALALVAPGLALAQALAQAQADYPNRPITIVVPFAPGGGTDMVSRMVAENLAKDLGVQVLVENRAGGNTLIAAQHVARAKPDGYTVLTAIDATMVMNPFMYSNLPYDPFKDFIPVTLATSMPMVIATHPDFPAKSIQDLIAQLKDKPGTTSYAFGAVPGQVVGELFKREAGVQMESISYNGSSPAQQDVIGGHVPVIIDAFAPIYPQLKGERLRPLAVTSAERAPSLPNVPTLAESGVPGFDSVTWTGFFVPAGTPEAVVNRLHQGFAAALAEPKLRERFAELGLRIYASPTADFTAMIQSDAAKYQNVIKQAGIKVN